ncbi:MAG TPA: sulfatase [Thermoanaerobaculia bacterium]|nr:sulfatase [Thermoanaerobaculia bacterium]
MRLSAPAAGLLAGAVTGIADAVIVHTNPPWAITLTPHVASFTWLGVIWTWMTVCCLAGALFSSPRLGRLRAIPIAFAGPGLLLLSRTAAWLKNTGGLQARTVLMVIAAVTCAIAAAIALIPLAETRAVRRYLAASLVSVFAIAFCGADVPLPQPPASRAAGTSNATQRNVVLIFLDTVRAGDARAMPRLGAFSRQAVTFENAWAPAPWTIPSHFAMLTGIEPWIASYDAKRHRYTHDAPLLSQQLQARGYETHAIFANYLLSEGGGFGAGFDTLQRSRESRVCASGIANLAFRVWLYNAPRIPWCGVQTGSRITASARGFVAHAKRPYLLAANYMDAHDPYYVERRCHDASFRQVSRAEREHVLNATPASPPNPEIAERVHAQYRAALQCLDRSLGELLDDVERDPRTVIAIVGDHGEQFGEHGLGWHGNSVYRQVLHVPLMIKAPGLAPARITDAVSISDLHRTLLTLADPSRGRARLPLLDAKTRRTVTAFYLSSPSGEGAVSVTRGDHHFIRWLSGREALYDYRRDPEETHPLSNEDIAQPLREIATKAARTHGSAADFRALGYLH